MVRKPGALLTIVTLLVVACATVKPITVKDPGVRGGPPGAGDALPGLTSAELEFFRAGLEQFVEVEDVKDGLGPRFNLDSCGGCHSQPATGGTSPSVNPQVAVAHKNGATNTVPSFISINGPIREARFKSDGGVHDLFTITGRTDAPGCNIAQPDFDAAGADLIFRVPTPTFGAGLMEAITDSTILANKKDPPVMGVSGRENREGNAGTITRFGWKAQNKSLVIFSGEAYNVEQGVSNELFPQERDETSSCLFNATPENHMNFEDTNPLRVSGDSENFSNFMRFLAPPAPVSSYVSSVVGNVGTTSINNGAFQFNAVGCTLCHKQSMTTGFSSTAALNGRTANLFSDLLLHDMGDGLRDDILQGAAGPRDFRTAPLWGLGQRLFFLHDGRTSNLLDAIQAHSSNGSEANTVISNFNLLSPGQKQDVLNFLRSL